MSKRKYKRGARIRSVGAFENCKSDFYVVVYLNGKEKVTHRAWLISWQYWMLAAYVNGGRIFVARENK